MHRKLQNLWHEAEPVSGLTSLAENVSADVAIVGGGYTGLSTALHLADLGKDVVLLEAQEIGYGASGRNVGLTNAGLWIMPQEAERLLGVEAGKRLNQFLIDAPKYVDQLISENEFDCDYKRNGSLHLAHSRKANDYLKARSDQLAEYGADVGLLNTEQAYDLTRAQNYYGALRDANAGTLQPLKYCQELTRLAIKKGVRIYTHSMVTDVERINGNIDGGAVILRTKTGNVTAGNIVLATNAYEQKLSQNKGLYTALHYCQLASEPLSEVQLQNCLPAQIGCWDSGAVMRSFRLDAQGRLIIGTVGDIHTGDAKIFKHWAAHVVGKTFPDIGEIKYEYAWAGKIAKSSNNLPQVQLIGENVYQIMGYSGRGIAPATVTGRMMAEFLCNNIPMDELPLPFNKANNISFNRLRAAVYEVGSQLSHLSDFILR